MSDAFGDGGGGDSGSEHRKDPIEWSPDRYKWVKDMGQPGLLEWVEKRAIEVDDDYQRNTSDPKVRQIRSKFCWPAFGVLLVARRPDGSLYVMDGQHRLRAALGRNDIERVPCIVFEMAESAEEASMFLSANTLRKPVTSLDKHKAQLLTGDATSMIIEELARSAGRSVGSSSATSVHCIHALRRIIESNGGEPRLRAVWPLIAELCSGRPLHEMIVSSMCHLERMAPGQIMAPRWRQRASAIGYDGLIASMQQSAAYHGNREPAVLAEGVVKALNKRLSKQFPWTPRAKES